MVRPSFVIAGAAKAGTSSLTAMVGQHPDVFVPSRKESHHFLHPGRPAAYTGPGDGDLNSLVVPSWDDYLALFEPGEGRAAVGEASVFYLTSRAALEEMVRRLDDVKVVVSLRDPAQRAFSAYSHLVQEDREHLSFADGLAAEEERVAAGYEPLWWYRGASRYAQQVADLLEVVGRERVLLLRFEDFRTDAARQVRTVFEFLGVDPAFAPDTDVHAMKTGQPKSWVLQRLLLRERGPVRSLVRRAVPARLRLRAGRAARNANLRPAPVPAAEVAALRAEFQPDVERLEELTGWDLTRWKPSR